MAHKSIEARRKYFRDYYHKNKERLRKRDRAGDRHRKFEFRRANAELYLLYSARKRARDRGLPYNIELSDIKIPAICPLLGMPISPNVGGKTPARNSPTVDRIVPEKGYVKGNVRVVSFLGNVMKRDASPEQIRIFAISILLEQGFLKLDY